MRRELTPNQSHFVSAYPSAPSLFYYFSQKNTIIKFLTFLKYFDNIVAVSAIFPFMGNSTKVGRKPWGFPRLFALKKLFQKNIKSIPKFIKNKIKTGRINNFFPAKTPFKSCNSRPFFFINAPKIIFL